MAKRRKPKRRGKRYGWWSSLDQGFRRRCLKRVAITVTAIAAMTGADYALGFLENDVISSILTATPVPQVNLVDLPQELTDLAMGDLEEATVGALARPWTDSQTCRLLAHGVAAVGWVSRVNYVRRRSDGVFDVSCAYRRPVAMVQDGNSFYLVDESAHRLPGQYVYDSRWKLIQGVGAGAPEPGHTWPGGDVAGGLQVLAAVVQERYSDQITGVSVANFGGRVSERDVHLELATDRSGGRIRWGSLPGTEVEENESGQKLAILRENYRRTGRADGGHTVIDISTFPDRFTIPSR